MKVTRTIGELCIQYANFDDFLFVFDILIDGRLVVVGGQRVDLLEKDNLNFWRRLGEVMNKWR